MVFNLLSGNDLQFRKQGVKKVANMHVLNRQGKISVF